MNTDNIKIVLIKSTHSGNIGSVARAMKTMGLSSLYLVQPQASIDSQAIALSAGASDILSNATICNDLDEAIADCNLVIGTSARKRSLQNTLIDCEQAGKMIAQNVSSQKIAILFGTESSGLTSDELLKCNYHLYIDTNSEYGSLNLAMAVQIICYEIRKSLLKKDNNISLEQDILASHQSLKTFFNKTQEFYEKTGFIKNKSLMKKVRHLYLKANLTQVEVNILLGMLNSNENFSKNK